MQHLFEDGLITYPRTDAKRYSGEFAVKAHLYLKKNYPNIKLKDELIKHKSKDNVQDAHESIRVTDLENDTYNAKSKDTKFISDVYDLIRNNTIKSFMANPIYLIFQATLTDNNKNFFSSSSSYLISPGVISIDAPEMKVYDLQNINNFKEGQELLVKKDLWIKKKNVTKAKPLFTEASLIKQMEINGVGRPSTYAMMTKTLFERSYITTKEIKSKKDKDKKSKSLVPTEFGWSVWFTYLSKYFGDLINEKYTSNLEKNLDQIENNQIDMNEFLRSFWNNLLKTLKEATTIVDSEKEICPECKKGHLVIKTNKTNNNQFWACDKYPDCKFIKR